jgi:phosphohistidine phosphatase
MKKLFLLRHGDAEKLKDGFSDFDRKLTTKGREDVESTARAFKSEGIIPDLFLSSNAPRAFETAKIFAKTLSYPTDKIETTNIFFDSSELGNFLDVVKNIDESINSLILIGHAPTFSRMASYLCPSFNQELKKAAVLGLDLRIDKWKDIKENTGSVLFYKHPID